MNENMNEKLKDILATMAGIGNIRVIQRNLDLAHGKDAVRAANLFVQSKMLSARMSNFEDPDIHMLTKDFALSALRLILGFFDPDVRNAIMKAADEMLETLGVAAANAPACSDPDCPACTAAREAKAGLH